MSRLLLDVSVALFYSGTGGRAHPGSLLCASHPHSLMSPCGSEMGSKGAPPSTEGNTYPEEDGVMRMLLGSCLITVALLCYPCVALGDEHSHRTAAENLLMVMEVDKSMQPLADQVLEKQLQHSPQ